MLDLPVVLSHGYLGFKSLGPLSYFSSARGSLEALGAKVYVTEVSPKGSLRERSNQLALEIRSFVPSGKVHVIAHSMGGLDARFLISQSHGRDLIATLTTLGSPFGGTLAADIRVDPTTIAGVGPAKLADTIWKFATDSILHPTEAILKNFTLLKGFVEALRNSSPGDYRFASRYFDGIFTLTNPGVAELTTGNCKKLFPSDCSDMAGVPGWSYGGMLSPAAVSPLLVLPALVLQAAGEPNDGIVPLSSAKLPDHRQTISADHLGLIGWGEGAEDVHNCFPQMYKTLADYEARNKQAAPL